MEKFTVLLNEFLVAKQIAYLLNKYNKLNKQHSAKTILSSNTAYLIQQGITKNNSISVIGCIGKENIHGTVYIKHICVHEHFRKKGIGYKLLSEIIKTIESPMVFMNIRTDNYPSLALAEKAGFLKVSCKSRYNYSLITVGRRV